MFRANNIETANNSAYGNLYLYSICLFSAKGYFILPHTKTAEKGPALFYLQF